MTENQGGGSERPGVTGQEIEKRSEASENGKSVKSRPDQQKEAGEHSEQKRAEQEEQWTRQEAEIAPEDAEAGEKSDRDTPGSESSPEPTIDKHDHGSDFPVVGVGASAGGLEALERFVSGLPEDSGIAFVMITHTHPEHPTRMPELLRRKSSVQVVLLEDGMKLEPDIVYVPPSDRDPVIEDGVIRLRERTGRADTHLPIDIFLKSLAEERGESAGCVILSGTGTDGTEGLRRIKENAGVAAAQSRESARHSGMPASAIETGMVDYILEPSDMPEHLVAFFRHPRTIRAETQEKGQPPETLSRILSFLTSQTDHDFSQYKKSTLIRRIERRMSVNRCRTMDDYLKFLHRNREEAKSLFQDLLIGVTNFFRDPEIFGYVRHTVLPDLLAEGEDGDSFRVWIPGCATGEEAYSVAIIVEEVLEELSIRRQVQIFATDIDTNAIEKARQGLYPKNITADVNEERLQRFFTEEENYYRVKKEVREQVVFAEQNVLRDPPFMHLDMLVCRNLLIYLEPAAQNKLLPLFHYNLKTGGILFLGSSESTGRFAELFKPVSKKFSIYKKRDTKSPLQQDIRFPTGGKKVLHPGPKPGERHERKPPDVAGIVEKNLLKHHTPPCVIVDQSGDIVYIHGRTGKFLEHAQGKPNMRITELAREGLRHALSAAFRRAVETREKAREAGVRVKTNGDYSNIDLTIKPLDGELKNNFMILFEEVPESWKSQEISETYTQEAMESSGDAAARRITELERELENLREDYRSTQEELETSNEELKSANEEMYSSNEELQSTNEELESSREELESLNEELSTVNSELHEKIGELQEAYSRITNVLNSTGIALVFLDNDLVVKRFTDEAARLINLIDKDVGRPIDHLSHRLELDDLAQVARRVVKNLSPFEDEVRTTDGHWYRMRIMAHRTKKNVIEGIILTFVNIDVQKSAQLELKEHSEKAVSAARNFAENIVDTVRESLLILDNDLRVVSANRSFYETSNTSAEQTEGRSVFEIGNNQWDIPELRRLLEEIIPEKQMFEDFRVEHNFEDIGYKRMRLNGRQLRDGQTDKNRILLAIEDMTELS